MRFFNIFVVFILFTVLTHAKRHSACREPVVFENFVMSRILGLWYEYSRFDHHFQEGCDCFTSKLVPIDKNSIRILNCCQVTSVDNETQNCRVGLKKATLVNPETKKAMFNYTRFGCEDRIKVESKVWVIDTDYDNYMIVNGCDDEEQEIFWILSREKELKQEQLNAINNVVETLKFDKTKIIRQHQEDDVCTSKRPTYYRLLNYEP